MVAIEVSGKLVIWCIAGTSEVEEVRRVSSAGEGSAPAPTVLQVLQSRMYSRLMTPVFQDALLKFIFRSIHNYLSAPRLPSSAHYSRLSCDSVGIVLMRVF